MVTARIEKETLLQMNTLNNAQMLILLVIVNVLFFFGCEYILVLPQNVSSKTYIMHIYVRVLIMELIGSIGFNEPG